ncbi:hypothetical protein CDAR_402871 [Caerostris darwini]|uniref:Uncharacterized protein n=1 Tax=Caerostris darwini TaxID=1538125 RepID=A0AAV4QWX9_9ARAC|nr:hypothetical protein CDAR_402871 [Caerostris darwini]
MCRVYFSIYLGPRVRSPNYQKLCTPSNRSLRMWRTSAQSKCYDWPLLGRSSFLIKDDSSASYDGTIFSSSKQGHCLGNGWLQRLQIKRSERAINF